jgi:hypothetical protein
VLAQVQATLASLVDSRAEAAALAAGRMAAA